MAAIIVHGGAYAIKDEVILDKTEGCKRAVYAGRKVLDEGGSCIDAVEAAVKVLEDDYHFNAGHGSALNIEGEIEMDAMIMEGKESKLGAVGGVWGVSNPVSLARLVMEKTEHTMLVGQGAKQLADEQGLPHLTTQDLMSPEMKLKRERFNEYDRVVGSTFNELQHVNPNDPGHDTVGAVARDMFGNIACATSTGGITLKRTGRVGDSPLIGCGGLADNDRGGVSTTGHGESITRVTLASRVLSLLDKLSIEEAIEQALKYMEAKTGGRGGLILVTKDGEIGKGFTTKRMAWASIDKNGILQTGIDGPNIF